MTKQKQVAQIVHPLFPSRLLDNKNLYACFWCRSIILLSVLRMFSFHATRFPSLTSGRMIKEKSTAIDPINQENRTINKKGKTINPPIDVDILPNWLRFCFRNELNVNNL